MFEFFKTIFNNYLNFKYNLNNIEQKNFVQLEKRSDFDILTEK